MNEEDEIYEDDESLLEEEELPGTETVDPEYEKKKAKKLTEAERAEAKEEFELGKATASELADKYGVTRQAMSQFFKSQGVKYGSRAHELAEAAKAAARQQAAATAERYSEQRQTWIEETRVDGYKDLKNAVTIAKKIVVDAVRAGRNLATTDDDLKAAQRYVRIIKEAATTRLDILDADEVVNEDDLPNLVIDDLTAEKIQDFHKMNGVEDEDELDEILENFKKDIT